VLWRNSSRSRNSKSSSLPGVATKTRPKLGTRSIQPAAILFDVPICIRVVKRSYKFHFPPLAVVKNVIAWSDIFS
jgi:hypothetical protein